MKLLLIGSYGQLGNEIIRRTESKQADPKKFEIEAVDQDRLDITDADRVASFYNEIRPDLVINAAAFTQVDKAETERELAYAVNETGPAHLAENCAAKKIPLIHVSTDFVFDGTQKTPYTENDPVFPLGVYGQSKAAGETAVRSNLVNHIIIRTAWLYSAHGQNFVKTMLRLGAEREELRVVADQEGNPTSAADLADAVLTVAEHIRQGKTVEWGTYHYCGEGITSWHGLAAEALRMAGQIRPMTVKRILAVPSSEYPTPAERPAYSAMDCTKIAENFGVRRRPWKESLEEVINDLLAG